MHKLKQPQKSKAFSLVEVVVATIIFLIAALGIFNVFFMAQKMSVVSGNEVIAANYGRQLLEDLRANVDWRTWNTGTWPLTCDSTWRNWPTSPTTGDAFYGLNTSAQRYLCYEDANGLRKVTLNVIW